VRFARSLRRRRGDEVADEVLTEAAAAEVEERYSSFTNRKNAYYCETCHGYIVTIDRDGGVTPMFLGCRATDGCAGMSRSMMYPTEPWPERDGLGHAIPTEPTWEWYRPDAAELARERDAGTLEHVRKGGLLLRRIET
jgi:hypothetical protein